MRAGPVLLCAGAAAALSACAAGPDRLGLAGFAGAAATVKSETDDSFVQANRIARAAAIDAFVRTNRPGLSEDAFPPAVPREVAAAWDKALGALVRYADLLASLTDASRSKGVGDAASALGNELGEGAVGAAITPSVAGSFGALARSLVQARADRRAQAVIVRTDPAVQALVRALVEAVGTDDAGGLRGTIWSNWTETFGPVRTAYAAAVGHDQAAQRRLAARYLALVDGRAAAMASLDNLVASLRALAAAHAAAARAEPRTARRYLAGIVGHAEGARRFFSDRDDATP